MNILALSRGTAARIDWQQIEDKTAGLQKKGKELATGGTEESLLPEEPLLQERRQQFNLVFDEAQKQFAITLASLQKTTNILVGVGLLSIAAAVAGGVCLALQQSTWVGGLLGGGGLVTLIRASWRFWEIGREQAILTLIPTNTASPG